ncbi:GDSL-type esterase/lipase family protein [Pedobacter immunditicola]|uniref:GDSL-type esterase/lipase family protein n=1 Tax=Pedobacter immunditicola TaxID=3133440 RepID=UPI0030A3C788
MMKTKYALLALVSLPLMLSAQDKHSTDTSYANGYYVKRLDYFKQLPPQKNAIVFLGNSITEVGDWQEVTAMPGVINRGISGDNSFGIFHRLDEILMLKPSKIFLVIGVNDIKRGTPLTVIAENYERIILKIRKHAPKSKLYLQTILPVNEPMLAAIYDNIRNHKIISLNELLKDLSEKYKLPYVDLYKDVFVDKNGQLIKELSTDGLHLQPLAYMLWADYLKQKKYL